jgi:hypothetical protein
MLFSWFDLVHSGLFSLSLSNAEFLMLLLTNDGGTGGLIFSDPHLATDFSASFALTFTHPFDFNPDRSSPEWSSSAKIQSLIIAFLQSRSSLQTIATCISNAFLASHFCLPSQLFSTVDFVTAPNFQLIRASVSSVRLASGATVGGTLIAILGVLGFFLILHRRRKVTEVEHETIDEFDLPMEHSNEIEVEVETADEKENCLSLEDEEEIWVRGGDELRLHFDGEESFSSPHSLESGEPRVN